MNVVHEKSRQAIFLEVGNAASRSPDEAHTYSQIGSTTIIIVGNQNLRTVPNNLIFFFFFFTPPSAYLPHFPGRESSGKLHAICRASNRQFDTKNSPKEPHILKSPE